MILKKTNKGGLFSLGSLNHTQPPKPRYPLLSLSSTSPTYLETLTFTLRWAAKERKREESSTHEPATATRKTTGEMVTGVWVETHLIETLTPSHATERDGGAGDGVLGVANGA